MIEIFALILFVIVVLGMVFGPAPYHHQVTVSLPKRSAGEPQPQSAS